MNSHYRERLIVLVQRIQRLHGMLSACNAEMIKILGGVAPSPDGGGPLPNLLGVLTDPKLLFDEPIIDETSMAVIWRGCRCVLGYTRLFDLIKRLVRNPGRWIHYDRLRRELWEDDLLGDTAIKVAVSRLRTSLSSSGMIELAAMIRISGFRCGYFPAGDPG